MTITYPAAGTSIDYSPFPGAKFPTKTPARQGFLRRALVAVMEARMKEAERQVGRYHHLVPAELEAAGRKIGPRNEDALPFVR
jgi:hypothetical protein